MKGYRKYFGKKILWFLITFVVAVVLNFLLPRLMPNDPIVSIANRSARGMSETSAVKAMYERYTKEFGVDKPLIEQFWRFVQPVSAYRGQYRKQRHPVDARPAVPGDHPWLDARQYIRRAGCVHP